MKKKLIFLLIVCLIPVLITLGCKEEVTNEEVSSDSKVETKDETAVKKSVPTAKSTSGKSEPVSSGPKTLDSIIKAFNAAGFTGATQKAEGGMLEHFSKITAPEKAVDGIIFQHAKNPCMIVEFATEAGAKKYPEHQFVKNDIAQKGVKSVTVSGKFVLMFDSKSQINDTMISVFKK